MPNSLLWIIDAFLNYTKIKTQQRCKTSTRNKHNSHPKTNIGSAVVRLIDENKNNPDLVKIVSGYVSEIKKALS
jgi:hypothetical protein